MTAPMDLEKVAEVAKWFSDEYENTGLTAISHDVLTDTPSVHVYEMALLEVAPMSEWEWVDRFDEHWQKPPRWEARATRDGVRFFSLFSQAKKNKLVARKGSDEHTDG